MARLPRLAAQNLNPGIPRAYVSTILVAGDHRTPFVIAIDEDAPTLLDDIRRQFNRPTLGSVAALFRPRIHGTYSEDFVLENWNITAVLRLKKARNGADHLIIAR